MSCRIPVAIVTALVLWAAPASAQQNVSLRFHDGLVTLSTRNAPLRAILTEWARLGGATIVNGDRVTGGPLTLELSAVPERQALDTLLRTVAGYMLAPRPADAPGPAVFNRIMILPTSTGPRNPPPSPAGRTVLPQPRMPMVEPEPDPEIVPEDLEENPPQDVAPVEDDAPVPNPQLRNRPGFPQMIQPEPDDVPQPEPDDVPSSPANPFGLPAGASTRPGVVQPVPQEPTGTQRGGQEP